MVARQVLYYLSEASSSISMTLLDELLIRVVGYTCAIFSMTQKMEYILCYSPVHYLGFRTNFLFFYFKLLK
jgi:hypothetical protein